MAIDTEFRPVESAFIGPLADIVQGAIPLTIASSKDEPFKSMAQGAVYIYLPMTGKERDYTKNAMMFVKATWVNPTDPAKSDWYYVPVQALVA